MRFGTIATAKPGGKFERLRDALAKKYPKVADDLANEFAELVGPRGPSIPSGKRVSIVPGFGGKLVKIRVASSDQQSGKSGGFRMLLYRTTGATWQPIMIWAKSDDEDMTKAAVDVAIGEDVP